MYPKCKLELLEVLKPVLTEKDVLELHRKGRIDLLKAKGLALIENTVSAMNKERQNRASVSIKTIVSENELNRMH